MEGNKSSKSTKKQRISNNASTNSPTISVSEVNGSESDVLVNTTELLEFISKVPPEFHQSKSDWLRFLALLFKDTTRLENKYHLYSSKNPFLKSLTEEQAAQYQMNQLQRQSAKTSKPNPLLVLKDFQSFLFDPPGSEQLACSLKDMDMSKRTFNLPTCGQDQNVPTLDLKLKLTVIEQSAADPPQPPKWEIETSNTDPDHQTVTRRTIRKYEDFQNLTHNLIRSKLDLLPSPVPNRGIEVAEEMTLIVMSLLESCLHSPTIIASEVFQSFLSEKDYQKVCPLTWYQEGDSGFEDIQLHDNSYCLLEAEPGRPPEMRKPVDDPVPDVYFNTDDIWSKPELKEACHELNVVESQFRYFWHTMTEEDTDQLHNKTRTRNLHTILLLTQLKVHKLKRLEASWYQYLRSMASSKYYSELVKTQRKTYKTLVTEMLTEAQATASQIRQHCKEELRKLRQVL